MTPAPLLIASSSAGSPAGALQVGPQQKKKNLMLMETNGLMALFPEQTTNREEEEKSVRVNSC